MSERERWERGKERERGRMRVSQIKGHYDSKIEEKKRQHVEEKATIREGL